MIQVHIDDEKIAATLRCNHLIIFDEDAGDRTLFNALHRRYARGNAPEG